MSNTFWQKIDEIFPQVADLPEAERERRLAELCGGDERVRREISALLAVDEKADKFIENPVAVPNSLSGIFAAVRESAINPTLDLTGQRFGAYRIVSKIGAGGMGAVYLAERADG